MTERVDLDLNYADGSPFVHKYYKQPAQATSLVVTFPGAHYGMDGPLLFYPALFLRQNGWDSLSVAYSFQSTMTEPGLENIPTVIGECTNILQTVLRDRSYARIAVIGKSLGCGVAAYLCSALEALDEARMVCLTPPLDTPYFDPVFTDTSQEALLAIGTADRFYDAELLAALQAKRAFTLKTFEDCDHSLVREGDYPATMNVLAELIDSLVSFLNAD